MVEFKSIVFFRVEHKEEIKRLREMLSNNDLVKVFETNDRVELQQIIEMSNKTALVVDKHESISDTIDLPFHKSHVLYRHYFLNFSTNKMSHTSIQECHITVINASNFVTIVERLELYLFGKLNIFKLNLSEDSTLLTPDPMEGPNKNFFTMLEYKDSKFRIILSSHEKEDDISSVIGRDWEELVNSVIKDWDDFKNERLLESITSHYAEFIFPHNLDGSINRISIIHILKGSQLEEQLTKVKLFLNSLTKVKI